MPGASGFQEIEGLPLLAGAFKKFGVSKIQGFQGKYIEYELGQKYHRKCIVQSSLRSVLFMGKTEPTGKRTPRREDIFKYGNNCSIIRSYYTSDYWQPGALVSFFDYIPGLLFPKKIMQSQSGSIRFRRVGFSICVHR